MADLAETEFRTVIEDARARHGAVIALIYFTDSQALGLLRLYLTLGAATASGAAAGFAGNGWVPFSAAAALGAVTICLIAGSAFCLIAMETAKINLPGREPAFWQWAMLDAIARKDALESYLSGLIPKAEMNDGVNKRTATALMRAKACSVAALVGGLLAGAVAQLMR